ncbi:MAG: hypothetical protein LBM09_01835 [Candidatus Nomurabacteria bacterium]|jgi:hypothetical protein|nr:hypothetical protein [Candidatus Nomurabacteria bacterium]
MFDFMSFIPIIAAAGGGGSSSGGSGGGGGLFYLGVLIGYIPMHLLGRKMRIDKKKHKDDTGWWRSRQMLVWIVGLLYMIILIAIGLIVAFTIRSGIIAMVLIIAGPCSMVGAGAGLYNWFGKFNRSKKEDAELKASGWNEEALIKGAEQIFLAYQRDWSMNNVAPMSAYLSPYYLGHAQCMVTALWQMGRRNDVRNVVIEEAIITEVNQDPNGVNDTVTIGFTAKADDAIVDLRTNSVIAPNPSIIEEQWIFMRFGNEWRLNGILPATANINTMNASLMNFALQNGMYYSLDWGWLLLPQRGWLFKNGKFGVSDVNNHCIGWIKGTFDNILTQIYTYNPNANTQYAQSYIIAQATLPRSYGDILVLRRKALTKAHGLREVSTEWQDFNKAYRVFATSAEQATSLELLNPKYMEQLAAVPFEVNIEVVDNVLYIFSPLAWNQKANVKFHATDKVKYYQTLLWLLHAAFKEMKM